MKNDTLFSGLNRPKISKFIRIFDHLQLKLELYSAEPKYLLVNWQPLSDLELGKRGAIYVRNSEQVW